MRTPEPEYVVLVADAPQQAFERHLRGVNSTLSAPARWAFVATNLGYWAIAVRTLAAHSVPSAAVLDCLSTLCASPIFEGLLLLLMAIVSTFFHGAQCRLLPPLYCEPDGLHAPRWVRLMCRCDVICALSLLGVSLLCFGPWHTCVWITAPALLFLVGRTAKRRAAYHAYALAHGLWHVLSAAAVWQILFNPGMPPVPFGGAIPA